MRNTQSLRNITPSRSQPHNPPCILHRNTHHMQKHPPTPNTTTVTPSWNVPRKWPTSAGWGCNSFCVTVAPASCPYAWPNTCCRAKTCTEWKAVRNFACPPIWCFPANMTPRYWIRRWPNCDLWGKTRNVMALSFSSSVAWVSRSLQNPGSG